MAKVTKRRGKWIVDYRLGKKRYTPSFSTKKEAEQFKRELELRKANAKYGHTSLTETSLKEAIHKYYELKSMKKSIPSRRGEKNYFEKLFEYFGPINVNEITLLDIEEFREHLSKSLNVKNSTITRHFNTYKNFFKKCEDWGFILDNPTRRLEPLVSDTPDKKLWKDCEIQILLDESPTWASDIFFTLALTGMRRSEVARLQWKNVKFEYHVIEVHSFKGNGRRQTRNIPMMTELEELLARKYEEARKVFKAKADDHVFWNASSLPVSATHISRVMFQMIEKLRLKGLNLHGLRHTFLTRMAAKNISLEKIRRVAGHSNLNTTQQYLHIADDEIFKAVEDGNRDRILRISK